MQNESNTVTPVKVVESWSDISFKIFAAILLPVALAVFSYVTGDNKAELLKAIDKIATHPSAETKYATNEITDFYEIRPNMILSFQQAVNEKATFTLHRGISEIGDNGEVKPGEKYLVLSKDITAGGFLWRKTFYWLKIQSTEQHNPTNSSEGWFIWGNDKLETTQWVPTKK